MKKDKYPRPGRPQIKKWYVISSTFCNSPKDALELIREWDDDGTLDSECRVFEITEKTKVFKPEIKLKQTFPK